MGACYCLLRKHQQAVSVYQAALDILVRLEGEDYSLCRKIKQWLLLSKSGLPLAESAPEAQRMIAEEI